ncbi:MAG: folate-binding protein YgfZ [Bdellovibrionales bacterium]
MKNGFYYLENPKQTIRLTGPDRYDFLQRLSSRNFKNPKAGEFSAGAFLNGNGTVVSLFHALVDQDQVLLIVAPQSLEKTLAFLDKFHFGENLKFEHAPKWIWIEVRGQDLQNIETKIDTATNNTCFFLKLPKWEKTGEDGLLIGTEVEASAKILNDILQKEPLQKLSSETYDFLQMKNFVPKDQVDVGETQIILEAGLYGHISRNKGCYPGQEVVERLFTYGNVAKKLVLLEMPRAVVLPAQSEIFFEGKKVGYVTSSQSQSHETLVFGVLQRMVAKVEQTYQIRSLHGDTEYEARAVIVAQDVPKD